MIDWITAIGLVLVIEGAVWALSPRGMKQAVAVLLAQEDHLLRAGGLFAAGLGLMLVLVSHSMP